MREIKVIVPGEPKGKARARVTKKGFAYTPEQTINYENLVKTLFLDQLEKHEIYEIPFTNYVEAEINCFFEIPKSMSKKKREQAINGGLRPTKKPDSDNIAKIILDSLNKIAYTDDSYVVDCYIRKWYSEQPRVEVILRDI